MKSHSQTMFALIKHGVERDDTLRLQEHAGNLMEVSPGNSVEIKPREQL